MSNQVKAEILSVGTELLLGQIANTNAKWLSARLAQMGVHMYYHGVVGDNEIRLREQFFQAKQRSDLVIVTGGLGPTDDDLTREVASEVIGASILEDEEALKRIQAVFAHRPMTPNNRKQARILQGSTILPNDVGLAPGFVLTKEGTTWIFLPGVPREMKAIMEQHGFDYIQSRFAISSTIYSKMLKFVGIGESQLEHDVHELIQKQTNPTIAPLASEGEVALRLTAKAFSEQEAKALISESERMIMQRVGSFCYGADGDTIEHKVFQLLQASGEQIAAAESLTGGQFMNQLISIPGASAICSGGIVCYTASVKEHVLNVPKLLIEQYGTVSEACAIELAVQVARKLHSSIGISFTGVAGPSELEGQSVGTVYIGIYHAGKQPYAKKFHFHGDREAVRQRSVKKGFELLYHYLK
ncbi:competence/damage-inducible protein A [Pontibacillus litoralis]|uniref:Putative competence-damage inducible protein n=1 Tax=Pontibacillus litoralis JSM 072002 TaxID=1385512 RepID=A0A0A5G8J0_9BACI|nr:competence/damage-inducible protein A [Pontibacillus litoralis]KGX88374.1 damage-inducible protein [Pontibacillus litoralis JSM 072002]